MINEKLGDYIFLCKNVLSDSLCDTIINEYAKSKEFEPSLVGNDGKYDEKVRKVKQIPMSTHETLSINYEQRKMIDDKLFVASGKAIQKYHKKYPNFLFQEDTGYELLKYEVGDFYAEHTDSFKDEQREVSCSFALNDNFEGGNFGFFNREKLIKVPKGSALMFPSNFMFPHEITPVTKGTRYSIITWFI